MHVPRNCALVSVSNLINCFLSDCTVFVTSAKSVCTKKLISVLQPSQHGCIWGMNLIHKAVKKSRNLCIWEKRPRTPIMNFRYLILLAIRNGKKLPNKQCSFISIKVQSKQFFKNCLTLVFTKLKDCVKCQWKCLVLSQLSSRQEKMFSSKVCGKFN